MYCRECGNKLGDKHLFCGKCGTRVVVNNSNTLTAPVQQVIKENPNDKLLYGLLGLIAPIVGLFLSLFSIKEKPEAAKVGLICSILRLCISIIFVFVYFFIIFYRFF